MYMRQLSHVEVVQASSLQHDLKDRKKESIMTFVGAAAATIVFELFCSIING